ncbi:hypothetical protein YC2023_065288 [Brassica napus]
MTCSVFALPFIGLHKHVTCEPCSVFSGGEDVKLVELDIKLVEQSNVTDVPGLSYRNITSVALTAIGEMAISKGRQGREV